MDRREFLKRGLAVAAGAALGDATLAYGTPPAVTSEPPKPNSLPGIHRLTGHVVLKGDPDYADAQLGRNTRMSSQPAVIVFCDRTQDVARAVRWSREYGFPLRIRSGRHSYEGYSSVDGGIVIDIRDLRRVRFDASRGTVRIGSGMSIAKLYEALWPHRVTVPAGTCPTVGVAGLALGGGYGMLARYFGLTCDNLLEVELVTADSQIIRANANRHSDLYWACRGGGGGNFGVVTSFEFRVHPVDSVTIFRMTWDWKDLEVVLNTWQSWAPNADERLTSVLQLKSLADGMVSSTGQFVGTADELTHLLAPLRAAGSPKQVAIETVSYMDAVETFAGQKPDREHWQLHWRGENTHFKHSSDYGDRLLTGDAASTIRHALEIAPGPACLVQFEAYGGAINRIAPESTAFIHRAGTLFNMQYQSYWARTADGSPYIAWVEEFRNSMQPFVSGRAYSNYCDSSIVDWPRAYYGGNWQRLREIKKKYDPDSVFRFPQGIS